MQSYFEDWRKNGGQWNAILAAVRPAFAEAASKYEMELLPVRWDEPSFTFKVDRRGTKQELAGPPF